MTTVRENIIDDIISSLAGTTNVSTRIYRSRVVPLTRGETPALVVEMVSDTPERTATLTQLDWQLLVRVVVITRGDKPDEVADPIVESLHAKIMADGTLGGYALDVLPSTTSFEMMDGDQPVGLVSCEYVIRYRTEITDLTQ